MYLFFYVCIFICLINTCVYIYILDCIYIYIYIYIYMRLAFMRITNQVDVNVQHRTIGW